MLSFFVVGLKIVTSRRLVRAVRGLKAFTLTQSVYP